MTRPAAAPTKPRRSSETGVGRPWGAEARRPKVPLGRRSAKREGAYNVPVRALQFWKTVTVDETNFLDRLLTLFADRGVRFCIVGGQAVNAYVDPLVSLDLDLVVAVDQMADVERWLAAEFKVERFPHSLNVSASGSNLRVQVQIDSRYVGFVERATERIVLGRRLPVAALEDVMRGKVWAVEDPSPRPSKRQKDLVDISRLLEAYPDLEPLVPAAVRNPLLR